MSDSTANPAAAGDPSSAPTSPFCDDKHPAANAEGVDPYDPTSPEMAVGFRGKLDAEMVAKLVELRGSLDRAEIDSVFVDGLGAMYLDDILLRFLRATHWDVAQARERILATIEWRKTFQDMGVPAVTRSTCDHALSSGSAFFCGQDKYGHPVAYIQVRHHNPKKFDPLEMRRVTIWCFEAGRAIIRPPTQMASLVFDLTGFGLSNMDYDYCKFLIATFRDYYPESLGLALIVNAPFIFKGCWKLIKGWLDPNTASKVHFVTKKEMTKYIPESQMHVDYGGTRATDPWPVDPPPIGSELANRLAATSPPPITSAEEQYLDWVLTKSITI